MTLIAICAGINTFRNSWPGPSAENSEMYRGFLLHKFLEDFGGGFFCALFPTKIRRKIR